MPIVRYNRASNTGSVARRAATTIRRTVAIGRRAYQVGKAAHSAWTKARGTAKSGQSNKPVPTSVKNESGVSTRQGAVTKTRSVKKNKRAPKVSPAFRKKVEGALQKAHMIGVFSTTQYESYKQINTNGQSVYDMSFQTGSPFLFNPGKILDIASVLWNSKDPSINHGLDPFFDFDKKSVVVNLVTSKTELLFKNNAQRTLTFDLYECLAKQTGRDNLSSPILTWQNAQQQDYNNGILRPSANAFDTFGQPTVGKFESSPGQTSTFGQSWKYTKRSFVLEPGQTESHTVKGPANQEFDFSKFWTEGLYNDVQKFTTMGLILVLKSDLLSSKTTSACGRYQTALGDVLICERKDSYTLAMPEQVGFQYPGTVVATGRQTLTQRKRRYCHNVWVNGDNLLPIDEVRVDEQQPK